MSEENETKIVIQHRGNQAIIGVQRNGCDPIFFMSKGDVQLAINHVVEFLREAEINWQITPRYPEAELPVPSPVLTPAIANQIVKTTAKPVSKQQEAMF